MTDDTVLTSTNDINNDEIWEIIDKEDDGNILIRNERRGYEKKSNKLLRILEDLRNLSAAVYAFILLVIGIPLWWRMTEVQRHPLPYTQISELGSMDVAIATDIFVYTKNPSETERIIEQIRIAFNSSNIRNTIFFTYLFT